MKRNLLLIIFLLLINISFGQTHRADNWAFPVWGGLKFDTDTPTTWAGCQINATEGSACISDTIGNLLFYSDGETVWDSTNTPMPNGTGLFGSGNSTQASLIVPTVGNPNQYYLFTTPALGGIPSVPAAYSIIDMTLNGGKGDVTSVKNIPLFFPSCEKLSATQHSNGIDFWVVFHKNNSADFYSYLVTGAGVDTVPVISTTGSIHTGGVVTNGATEGELTISPCGNMIAVAVCYGIPSFLEIAEFDNSTGQVSCCQRIGTWNPNTTAGGIYGVEFSPNGSKLYGSIVNGHLLQWDLTAGDSAAIAATKDTIFTQTSGPIIGALQLGIDGRIYLSRYGQSQMGCVTEPNQLGLACNYNNSFISGGIWGFYGLPNFLTSYFCSGNATSIALCPVGIETIENNSMNIFPNPFDDKLIFKNNGDELSEIILYDIAARKIMQTKFINSVSLSTEQLAKGLYLYEVRNKDGSCKKGKVVKD